jgi:hypothetical protein
VSSSAKRCGTGRVDTLAEHHTTPLRSYMDCSSVILTTQLCSDANHTPQSTQSRGGGVYDKFSGISGLFGSSANEDSLLRTGVESLLMVKRAPARRRPRKAKSGTKGLIPAECRLDQAPAAAAEAVEAIEKAGGCLVGSYKEPLGGHPVLLSILPIDAVVPTPFQRDLSDAHHKRLADVINKTGRIRDCSPS